MRQYNPIVRLALPMGISLQGRVGDLGRLPCFVLFEVLSLRVVLGYDLKALNYCFLFYKTPLIFTPF